MKASDVIDIARLDFPESTEEELLVDLQQVHNELCFDFRLIKDTIMQNLTAGIETYALSADVTRVFQARFRTGPGTAYNVLRAVTADELDQWQSHWRGVSSGNPTQFFVEAGEITITPPPMTSTSSGYPLLEYDVAKTSTLSASTDLPHAVSYEAWVNGLKWRAALRLADKRLSIYAGLYRDSRQRLAGQVHATSALAKQMLLPKLPSRGRRV